VRFIESTSDLFVNNTILNGINIVDTISQALKNIGPTRLAIMGGVMVTLLGFFIYLTSRLVSPSMDLLYADLDPGDFSKIVSQIESQKIPYELRNNGTQIYVASDKVGTLRMSLADQGIPGGASIGFELFDDQNTLGTTNFLQNVNLLRALEGELARTIKSINFVRSARVHLVMPKRELFSRKSQQPSASVFLQMKSSVRLNTEQIASVQHLIAAAVPNLTPDAVSIIDNKGKLLAAGFEGTDSTAKQGAKSDDRQRAYQNRTARVIEQLLERTVGFGKVRAEVTVDMDFDRISTQQEVFDPDGQVLRSTQTIDENSNTKDASGSVPVSVGTNLPDPTLGAGDSQNNSTEQTRSEATENFDNSKKVINTVREVGIVKKLSVAVLVDGARVENADGNMEYKARSEQEMELLATLVKGSIGFDADRGDVVEVINMEFADFTPPEIPLELFFGLDKNSMLRLAEILVLSIVALLVILLVVRPLVSRAFESIPSAAAAGERLLADQFGSTPALAGPGAPGIPAPTESFEEEDDHMDELIDIERVEGRVKASSVKKVGEIVEKHPDEALSIIRAWMYQDK